MRGHLADPCAATHVESQRRNGGQAMLSQVTRDIPAGQSRARAERCRIRMEGHHKN